MKMLRYLFSLAFICCLTHVAHASNFQMVVVDPNPLPGDVTLITSDNFTVTLSPCDSSQLPSGLLGTYLGCFTGLNVTGQTLTSLQLLIPVFNIDNSQAIPGCGLVAGNTNVFPNPPTCGVTQDQQDFFVDFSGGDLPTAKGILGDCDGDNDGGKGLNADDISCDLSSIFTIAVGFAPCPDVGSQTCKDEAALIDKDFNGPPGGPGTTAVVTPTPEPSSALLMSTGILSLGLFGAYRRQKILVAARPPSAANLD